METTVDKELIGKIEEFYITFARKYRDSQDVKDDIGKLLSAIDNCKTENMDIIVLQYFLKGLELRQNGYFLEAITQYNAGINKGNSDTRFKALILNGKGNCYRELKKFECAIETYEEVIKIIQLNMNNEGYEKSRFLTILSIFSYNELGNIYRFLKKNSDAQICYKAAIDQFKFTDIQLRERIPFPYHGLGFLYYHSKNYLKAKVNWEKALEGFTNRGEKYKIWEVTQCLEQITKEEQYKKYIKSKKNYPEFEILERTIEVENETEITKMEIASFLEIKKTEDRKKEILENHENKNEYFQVLRRWNSYSPILNSDNKYIRGGGYFFSYAGFGIVIDPGFNFIQNFIEAGHKFYEIDKVFISHAHNDHTADIESILTLLHEYNENVKGVNYIDRIFELEEVNSNTLFSSLISKGDLDPKIINEAKLREEMKKYPLTKRIDFYIPLSVFQKYSGLFKLYSDQYYSIKIVEANQGLKNLDKSKLSFIVLPANHTDIITDCKSVGFCFQTDHCLLFYTGDTGYTEELGNQYKQSRKDYGVGKNIILLAHFGGFKNHERFYPFLEHKKNGQEALYKNHLGRLGLIKLIRDLEPEICYISEFGEEFRNSNNRIKIAKIFDRIIRKTKFIPSDIGLKFDFLKKIEVEKDRNSQNFGDNKEFIDVSSVDYRIKLKNNVPLIIYRKKCSKKAIVD